MVCRCAILILITVLAAGSWNSSSAQGSVDILLSSNTADHPGHNDLIRQITAYMTTTRNEVWWVINGDIFPSGFDDNQILAWKSDFVDLLDAYENLTIVLNQGDRDWGDGEHTWARMMHLQKLLTSSPQHDRLQIHFGDGCPGPWTISLNERLKFVLINSQWFNVPYDKPIPATGECAADLNLFREDLTDLIEESKEQLLILSHHPVYSVGPYGGTYPWYEHFTPPIIGSARVAFHQHVGNTKDISNEYFDTFRQEMISLFAGYNNLIFISGHEKNNSVLELDGNYHINSGAVVPGTYARDNRHTLLATDEPGIIRISTDSAGNVGFDFLGMDMLRPVANWKILVKNPCAQEDARAMPCDPAEMVSPVLRTTGQTTRAANPEYAATRFKAFWLGDHYRESWIRPVEVPYIPLDTIKGGLRITGRGGGRQTISLRFLSADGKAYVFRSVDKDPSKALNEELRGTIISRTVRDQTTTEQPYGALAAAPLLDRIDILHASPELYVIPPDTDLGMYQDDFAGMMGLLEEFPTDNIEEEAIFAGADDIDKSHTLFRKLYRDHDNQVDQEEFCRARIFDMLVGDWGKHEDNWKWAGYKTDEGKVFRPIPRDRDHVFSLWDGLLPYIADREWAKPSGENFGYRIKGLRSLMWQARHLDRFLGNRLIRQDWLNEAHRIQESISGDDIVAAVARMPEEIYEPDGRIIEEKLKQRLKDLHMYAEEYYEILAKEVDVVGSNKREYFHVWRNPDGTVRVTVNPVRKSGEINREQVLYDRTFFKHETNEIRLFGLGGDDIFELEGTGGKSILVRVVGGAGKELIVDKSEVKGLTTRVYELDTASVIERGKSTRIVHSNYPDVYQYDRTAFKYNTYLPAVALSYNQFTGAGLHAGVSFTRQNFEKPDFSAKHNFRISVTTEKNYEIGYHHRLRYVLGKWDLVSGIHLSRPLNYNYFFGIGNNTRRSDEFDTNYYRAQYNSFGLMTGLSYEFWKYSSYQISAHYEFDEGITRGNSYVEDNPDVFGTGNINMFYLMNALDLDLRDSRILPGRGFRFFVSNFTGHIREASSTVSSLTDIKMEQFLSTFSDNPVTFGIRIGGGFTHGELPYYKLFTLGQSNDLTGFKRNRFTGDRKGYANFELRWQILEKEHVLIPIKFGVRALFDYGRVWADTDEPGDNFWHKGYGFGFYVVPFNERAALNLSLGFSDEESYLVMFGIGALFN